MNEDIQPKVVLRILEASLVVDADVAMQVARLLCGQNLQKHERKYVKDEVSGNYGYVDAIRKANIGDVNVAFLPAVDYFRYCQEGDKE